MICVLRVVHGPATGKKCWLRRDQRVTIGRQSNTDFSVCADAHMSRHHLIVEGVGETFRLRDVGSSNGTFVNEFKVTVVELCNGDLIKAGSSVFEVGFEPDECTSVQFPIADESEIPAIPTRTLAGQELEHAVEELTMHYEVPREGLEVSRSWSVGAVSEQVSEPSRTGSIDVQSMGTAGGPWESFLAEFTPGSGALWQQNGRGSQLPARILDRLMLLDAPAHYNLIVNRWQVDGAEKGTLDFILSTRESRALTETLCLLESRKAGNIIEFYKRCLGKDAAICVVSPEPLSDIWLQNAIDSLSYPSLFGDVVARSTLRASQLASGTHFVLFEPNSEGELRLLRASRVADESGSMTG